MNMRWIGALGIALLVSGWQVHNLAQTPTCLHGENESTDQQARRQAALTFTRHINTIEAATSRNGQYQALAALPVTQPTPVGFAVNLVTDGRGYAFSVKDTTDRCGFAYFSDQDGRIYVGTGLQ